MKKLTNKTSRREIAINNRLRDRAEKAALLQRQARNRVVYPIGALVVLALTGSFCYLIYDSLITGVALLGEKAGPVKRYSVVAQPGMYWLAVFMYAFWVVMGIAGLKLMFFFYKLEARK